MAHATELKSDINLCLRLRLQCVQEVAAGRWMQSNAMQEWKRRGEAKREREGRSERELVRGDRTVRGGEKQSRAEEGERGSCLPSAE